MTIQQMFKELKLLNPNLSYLEYDGNNIYLCTVRERIYNLDINSAKILEQLEKKVSSE